MSTNPFDDEKGSFFALINVEGQYSLWPSFAAIPDGWNVVLGDADRGAEGGVSRAEALAYIDDNWTALQSADTSDA